MVTKIFSEKAMSRSIAGGEEKGETISRMSRRNYLHM